MVHGDSKGKTEKGGKNHGKRDYPADRAESRKRSGSEGFAYTASTYLTIKSNQYGKNSEHW